MPGDWLALLNQPGAALALIVTLPGLFWRGLLMGFSIAAPVGPIGVLCIRRSLANGGFSGFVSGLGAASADALYGSIAGLGLTFVAGLLVAHKLWLGLLGGVFLLYLGIKTLLAKPGVGGVAGEKPGEGSRPARSGLGALAVDYVSALLLTLTNPMTILSFTAIFAGLGLAESGFAPRHALWMVAGVFVGSAAWWLILSSLASSLRQRFLKPGGLAWVNRVSGVIILGFGILALVSVAIQL